MNHCRDCKHFNRKETTYRRDGWCRCDALENDGSPLAQLEGEGMYEGVSLFVSPDFGCVQFEERE